MNFELPAPVLAALTTMGDSVFVRWNEIAGATSYMISLAYDADFTKPAGMMGIDASRTWATLPEVAPDTTYFIRVKAFGDGSANSDYSNVRSVRTLPEGMAGTSDETATHLQNWLGEEQALFQNFAALLPQLVNTEMSTDDRRRLNGSGVRRYGFIEKVLEVSGDYPQFWQGFAVGEEALRERVNEIDVLRNLVVWFRFASRVAGDLLLLAGDDAFRIAGSYYASARDGARRKNTEAQKVYDMLRLLWNKRRRTSSSEQPTQKQVRRDVNALQRGTKEGKVSITRKSPEVSGGKLDVFDETHRCKRKRK